MTENNPLNLSEKELAKFNAKRDKLYSELHTAMNTPDKIRIKKSDKPISYFTKEQQKDFNKLQRLASGKNNV